MGWEYREEDDCFDDGVEVGTLKAELALCREWAEAIGHHVYCTGSISGLEEAVEELYAVLEITLPTTEPKMTKVKGPLFELALDLSKKERE